MGTHVLLEAARVNNITRFIHISTDEVYGEVEHGGVGQYGRLSGLSHSRRVLIFASFSPI